MKYIRQIKYKTNLRHIDQISTRTMSKFHRIHATYHDDDDEDSHDDDDDIEDSDDDANDD